MSWLKSIGTELVALFVDDGSYALAIVVWLLAAWLLLPRLHLAQAAGSAIFFAGLVFILLESVTRRARSG
jgi:hypothetical protein